jgi:hypothetical protein
MKRGLWAASIITALLLIAPVVNAAKAPNGVQVMPLRAYPTQNPGTVTTGSLTITNYTTSPQQILLSTETFHTTGEDYRYAFGSSDAAKWVQFEESTIQLAPKEAKVAKYSIVAPGDAAPGGKYLALITTIAPEAGSQKITEIRRIASLVYLQINGQVTRISSLISFDAPRLAAKPNFIGNVRVNNGGNTHFQSRVAFYVNRWPLPGKGTYVTQLEGFVLPGTVRQLSTIIHIPRSPGVYRVTAEYAPPQGGVNRISNTVFYIPMWFVISIVLFLVVLIILIIRFWRSLPTPKRKRIIHN